tara:strand:- start:409 stop:600 length:192 start_codon:yes stop_codon:yes gene_type:complete
MEFIEKILSSQNDKLLVKIALNKYDNLTERQKFIKKYDKLNYRKLKITKYKVYNSYKKRIKKI